MRALSTIHSLRQVIVEIDQKEGPCDGKETFSETSTYPVHSTAAPWSRVRQKWRY